MFVCVLAIGIISTALFSVHQATFAFVLLPTSLVAFAIGGLYAYSTASKSFEKRLTQALLILLPVAVILFYLNQFGYRVSQIRLVNSVIAINLIIYTVKEKYSPIAGWILNNRVLNNLGKLSYGIYLYHFTLPGLCDKTVDYFNRSFLFSIQTLKTLKYPPPAYLLHLVVLLLISYLSYVLVESRFLKLKKYFSYSN